MYSSRSLPGKPSPWTLTVSSVLNGEKGFKGGMYPYLYGLSCMVYCNTIPVSIRNAGFHKPVIALKAESAPLLLVWTPFVQCISDRSIRQLALGLANKAELVSSSTTPTSFAVSFSLAKSPLKRQINYPQWRLLHNLHEVACRYMRAC